MTRYVSAFSWTHSIQRFLNDAIPERPLLNVCAGRTRWGDVTMDRYEPADVMGDWTRLPFDRDSFAAVFADPPWNSGYKAPCAAFVREALRVAPVVYLMAPWVYGSRSARLTATWVRQFPGVQVPILLTRYERPEIPGQLTLAPHTASPRYIATLQRLGADPAVIRAAGGVGQ